MQGMALFLEWIATLFCIRFENKLSHRSGCAVSDIQTHISTCVSSLDSSIYII